MRLLRSAIFKLIRLRAKLLGTFLQEEIYNFCLSYTDLGFLRHLSDSEEPPHHFISFSLLPSLSSTAKNYHNQPPTFLPLLLIHKIIFTHFQIKQSSDFNFWKCAVHIRNGKLEISRKKVAIDHGGVNSLTPNYQS